MATLITYNGTTIPVGATAELDHNFPVTVTAIREPHGEDDPGTVTIRHSWGETEELDPVRLNTYISLD